MVDLSLTPYALLWFNLVDFGLIWLIALKLWLILVDFGLKAIYHPIYCDFGSFYMAKAVLTKEAIKFIVETYNSEKSNYTFQDIVNLIDEKFGLVVSVQSVHKSYHKHKDSFNNSIIKEKPALIKNEQNTKPKKIEFNRKIDVKKQSSSFDDSTPNNDEIQELLKPKGEI